MQYLPEQRTIATSFANGAPLGRLNDIIADGKGGAYFTQTGAYYVSPAGVVSTVADQDIRSNGIMLSPDGKTLYVTNNTVVLAFDVRVMARLRTAATSARSTATTAVTAWPSIPKVAST